jgi:hypothetical protein
MAGPRPPTGVPFLPPSTVADRAFAQNVDRLVRRTTIVNSADDIRRNITLCLVGGRPCTLEMGSNIASTSGYIIPGGLKAFSLDGAQRFKIIVSGDLPFLFYAKGAELNNGCPVDIHDVTIQLQANASLETVFVVEQVSAVSAATFSDTLTVTSIYVDATAVGASCTNLFAHGDYQHPVGFRIGRFFAEDVSINGVDNVLAFGDATMFWTDCSVRNMLVSGTAAATFGQGIASSVFNGIVENLVAPSTVFSVGSRSTVSLQYARLDSFIGTSVSVLGKITLLRVFTATTRTLTAFDVDLDNIVGGGGGTTVTAAAITVPFGLQEQTVTVVDASCTALSNVIVGWGSTAPTDENQPGACAVTFSAVPAAGSLDVTVSSDNADPVGGTYKILYTLG